MRKKLIQIIKYTAISIVVFLSIIIISVFGVWSLFLIKDSVSFKPTKNIFIKLSGLSIFPNISLKNISVQLNDYNTDLEFQNIQIQLSLRKPQKLCVSIESCNIHVDTTSPFSNKLKEERKTNQETNVPNFQSFFTYLPQKLFVKNISMFVNNHERTLFVSGIPLTIDKAQNLISLSSTGAIMEVTYNGQKESLTGTVDIHYQLQKESQEIGMNIQFAPYMLAQGKVNFDNSMQRVNIEDMSLSLDENVSQSLSPLIYSMFSLPVDWQKIQVSHLQGSVYYQGARWIPENINGEMSFSSLTIGDKEKPWLRYTSEIHIHSQYKEDEKATEVVMNSDKAPVWKMNWKYNHVNQNTYLDFSCGTIQGKTIQEVSPYLYNTLLLKQIEPFSVECSLALQGILPILEGNIQGKLSIPNIDSIRLNSDVKFIADNKGSNQIKWSGDVNVLSYPIHFSAEWIPFTTFISHIQTEKFPAKFIQSLTPSLVKKALETTLADIEVDIKGKEWNKIDLQFKGVLSPEKEDEEYLPIVPSEFGFQGIIQNLETVVGAFRLSSENSTDFELNPCKLYMFPVSLEGDMKTKIYLSTLSSEFLPFYIPGKAEFHGKLHWNGSLRIKIQGSGSGEGLGIGGYMLPEGIPLCFNTDITGDFSDYTFEIENLMLGFKNWELAKIQKGRILLTSDNHNLAVNIQNLDVKGTLNDLQDWGISQESQGTYYLSLKNFEYKDNQVKNGEIEWDVNISKLGIPTWQIQVNNFVSQLQPQNLRNTDLAVDIKIDEIASQKVKISQIENSLRLKFLPPEIEITRMNGNLWKGKLDTQGIVQKKEGSLIGNIAGEYAGVDLSQFTAEVQPPWVNLSGRANGNFDANINFTQGQLVEGNFSLLCPEGLTINRDVLLRLILYLQNVSIVQKQLEKLLGKEDPKPFTNGELTVGFKDNQATVSLLLTTPNMNLAPIFYINADWKTLWSLITTPSDVQIDIK